MTKKRIITRISILIIFVINSFFAWLIFTLGIIFNEKRKSKDLLLWSMLTVILISLYNATKIPENDLVWYSDYYLLAGTMPFPKYMFLLTGGKEVLYQVLVYLIYSIGGNNVHFYIFTISLISYSCMLRGLYIISTTVRLRDIDFIFAVFVLCFFPYTFALSVHLVRQFLATAIMFLLLSEFFCKKKNLYWIIFAIMDVFIHSSVVFFIPLFFFHQISRPITKKNLYIYVVIALGLLSLSFIASLVLPYLTDSYTLSRITDKAINGTTFETNLPLYMLLSSFSLTAIAIYSIYFKKTLINNPAANYITNISICLLYFITINPNSGELQLRYNYYFWSLPAFFTVIYLKSFKISHYIKLLGMFFLFISWNIYNIMMSDWTYTCSDIYFLYPIFTYFS